MNLLYRIQLCFIKVSTKVKSESLCCFENKYQLKACFSFKFVYIIHLHPKVCYQNADILRLLFRYMTNNATIFEIFSGTNQMWDTYTLTHTLNYTRTQIDAHFTFGIKRWHKFMIIKLALTYCLISRVWIFKLNFLFISFPPGSRHQIHCQVDVSFAYICNIICTKTCS